MRYVALLAGIVVVCVILLATAQPYERARLTSFLHPWASATKSGAGYQAVQGQIALGSGGLFGVGLGRSVQKIFYLPEAQTDFILAVIGEELGVLGILGVVCLYGMIAYAGLRTARRAADRYAKLLATGLTSLILCQGILNIFVVLGLAPLTGVPLPFISYAPTNLCVLLAGVGAAAEHRPPGAAAATSSGHRKLKAPRIVIGAGGTAGHVVPALAVADALRAEGAEVTFVGGDRAELELVPAAGYELRTLRVMPLPRGHPLKAVRAALVAAAAVREARRIVKELRPAAILAGGGYVAGPVGLAAVLSRVPLVLTEADSHLGLTNRLLAPFARRVCLAFPIEGRDGSRYVVTGRPVPPPATDWQAARARFGIGLRESCVLVFGGSQGARSINRAAVEAFAGARFRVLHAAGERDLRDLRPQAPGAHYDLRGYIPRFGEALLASDLVVARAGGSIFEIAAHGKPAVLVPYPYATADHQTANARFMESAGAAVVIPDSELTPARLANEVGRLLADRGRLAAMARASAALARPDAARDIAHELLSAARDR